jgi:hypothetical protein
MRSRPECKASENSPRLPVNMLMMNLNAVKNTAANTDIRAIFVFS